MSKAPRVAARISEGLRKKLNRAMKSTNHSETAFVTTALEEFLKNHKTPTEKIAAFVTAHAARRAG